jgi:hypothetical protein
MYQIQRRVQQLRGTRTLSLLTCGFTLLLAIVFATQAVQAFEMERPAFQGAAPVEPGSGTGFPTGNITLGFNIILNYNDAPTGAEAAAFTAAEATWEGIIAGYLIDDIANTNVTININLDPIDGAGGILGSAGPTHAKLNAAQSAVSSTYIYTQQGSMTFDTADTAALASGGALGDVIRHEMGHVLGIGTLWDSSDVGFPGRQELYVNNSGQYTGTFGLAAYNAEFGQVGLSVPVELGGGAGTANGHWNEVNGGGSNTGIVSLIQAGPFNDFRYELMTGWLNAPTYISSLTRLSMTDLGYVLVPEPSSFVLVGLGMSALLAYRRRQS